MIYDELIQTMSEIQSVKVFRTVFCILGEYVGSLSGIQNALWEIRKVLGEIPILASEQMLLDKVGDLGFLPMGRLRL